MESKSWTFLLSLDTVSFRKSQTYWTRSLYVEPTCPFLQSLQIHVQSKKHKASWEEVGIYRSQRAVLVSGTVQIIEALRQPWLTALLLEQPRLPNSECLTYLVWFLQKMYDVGYWRDGTGCVWVSHMAQECVWRARAWGDLGFARPYWTTITKNKNFSALMTWSQ